jgi:type I restriction-modification system DNA methylase subunit
MDGKFAADLNALAVKAGYKNGLADIIGQDYSRIETLARMMVYVLMNKIIFYKVLERHYMLPELKPLLKDNPEINSEKYLELLNQHFKRAIEETGDFEHIFITGLFDNIVLSEERGALIEIDELIHLLSAVEVERLGDVIGPIYEDLIPAEERHQMGQFYTPQPIAELIARWCINNNPSALILGPGCGSGTFEVEAYWILSQLKTGRKRGIPPGKDIHKSILKQIYAVDINPFPTQLTAMNLAMKNVRAPTTEANIVTADFFSIIPGQKVIASYPIMTPYGPKHKEIAFPEKFDVIMGNPPYTRWGEIQETVQQRITERVGGLLESYDLLPIASRRGAEYTMVVFWIAHSIGFLKDGGRLGMIVSDSWLQTTYGVRFGRLLADHFKIHAIIDISSRVFPVPLIGTCIILLERCSENAERDSNSAVFAYLNIKKGRIDVLNILKVIEDKKPTIMTSDEYDIVINVYKQSEVRSYKAPWITFLFNADYILNTLQHNRFVTKLETYFEPVYGNTMYTVLYTRGIVRTRHAGVGGEEFFYLTDDEAKRLSILNEFLTPLIPSSRYMSFFTFTKDDWRKLKEEGAKCYLFLCHKPRNELPKAIRNYIELGETKITLAKGVHKGEPVSHSRAAEERRRLTQYFFDWYDLGNIIEAPIYVARGTRYWSRYVLVDFQCALDDRILALIPKQNLKLNELELKALLAYLNSSFGQLQAEVRCRTAGGVALLELDVKPLSDFLVLDVKKLPKEDVKELANLFDKLESEARRLGGADKAENVFGSDLAGELTGKEDIKGGVQGIFNTVVKEIDEKIAEVLEVEALVEPIRTMIVELAKRRLSRAMEARPDVLKGSEEPLRRSGRKRRKRRSGEADEDTSIVKLTDFIRG